MFGSESTDQNEVKDEWINEWMENPKIIICLGFIPKWHDIGQLSKKTLLCWCIPLTAYILIWSCNQAHYCYTSTTKEIEKEINTEMIALRTGSTPEWTCALQTFLRFAFFSSLILFLSMPSCWERRSNSLWLLSMMSHTHWLCCGVVLDIIRTSRCLPSNPSG